MASKKASHAAATSPSSPRAIAANDALSASPAARSTAPPAAMPSPGHEHQMECKPSFQAPTYQGSGKLQGLTALITGGDSGIGRAVAVLFAREGANVAIAYWNEEQDAKLTCKHIKAEGGRSLAIAGDVRDPDFCAHAVQQVLKKFGRLNILVNNAAVQAHAESQEALAPEQVHATFATNMFGYMHMARAALPHLQRGDCIINTGSITGLRGSAYLLDYAATKGAIHAWTKSLAANLAERGIRVNAIAPGPVWTPLNPAASSEDDFANFGADTDIGRAAQPEEISPAYVFLASPVCASYITGVVLPVTGNAGD